MASDKFRYTGRPIWLSLVCAGLLAGCSFAGQDSADQSPSPDQETDRDSQQVIQAEPVGPIEYQDGVFEVSDQTARTASAGDETLRVPLDEAGDLAERRPGDIVFSRLEDHAFRLEITDVYHRDAQLVFEGRVPELGEVVEHGSYRATLESPSPIERPDDQRPVVDMNQGRLVDAATYGSDHVGQRHQAIEVGGGAFSASYDETDLPEGPGADLTSADVGIHPAVTVQWEIVSGVPMNFEVSVDADVDLNYQWELTGSWSDTFTDDPFGSGTDIQVAGGEEYSLDGQIEATFDFSDVDISGSGHHVQNLSAAGSVNASVNEDGTLENHSELTATHTTDGVDLDNICNDGTDPCVTIETSLDLSLEDSMGTLLDLTPLDMTYDSHAQVDTGSGECPWSASLENTLRAESYSPYNVEGPVTDGIFDHNGTIASIDDCRPRGPTTPCSTDSDCGEMMSCNTSAGVCQVDGDMEFRLDWDADSQPAANLELYVELPGGTIISEGANQATSDAAVVQSSCGGCNQATPGGQFQERIAVDNVDSGDTFRAWVLNHDDVTGDPLDYQLSVFHHDVYENTFGGTLGTSSGDTSLYFFYSAP